MQWSTYMQSFFNKYYGTAQSAVSWIHGCGGGPTIKLYEDFWPHRGSVPLTSPLCAVQGSTVMFLKEKVRSFRNNHFRPYRGRCVRAGKALVCFLFSSFGFFFFSNRLYFLEQFEVHRKIEGKVQRVLIHSLPPYMHRLPSYYHPH